jgi:hypothetical protein
MKYFSVTVAPAWKMALVRAFGTRRIELHPNAAIEYYVLLGRKYITKVTT